MAKRLTSARAIVLETLEEGENHLSTQEVYERAKTHLPSLNISTVYRALDYLAEQGLISVSDLGRGTPVYQAISEGLHHHLVCQECGAVFDLDHAQVKSFFEHISKENDFKIRTNHLVLFGICKRCRAAS
jgi:Fur family ferric uptake transcriptional regulator